MYGRVATADLSPTTVCTVVHGENKFVNELKYHTVRVICIFCKIVSAFLFNTV